MSKNKIDKAFILAAGLGTRMGPITDTTPKPLVQVKDRTLLDRTIDHLARAGTNTIVINSHHHADQIANIAKTRTHPQIHITYEEKLLDTGGGIKNALGYFGDQAFYVLSGDGLWTDGPNETALNRIAQAWDPAKMDILILLQPLSTFDLTEGVGDYDLDKDGRAARSLNRKGAHMFTSMRINHPRIFAGSKDGAFSYLDQLDAAQRAGRLYGLIHDGQWHHISTPDDLAAVNKGFSEA